MLKRFHFSVTYDSTMESELQAQKIKSFHFF